MNKKVFFALPFFLSHATFSYAQGQINFYDFMSEVYDKSHLIQSKKLDLDYEKIESKKADFYYLPKLTASSSYKTNKDNTMYFDSEITAKSTVFASSLHNKFNETYAKINAAELSLNQEKETLKKTVLENLIALYYYKKLENNALELKNKANDIYNQIERRFDSGVAKISDLEQGRLLKQRLDSDITNIDKEISLLMTNIEIATGVDFPNNGIKLPEKLFNELDNGTIADKNIKNNIEYKILKEKADIELNNAKQQDTFMNVGLSASQTYHNSERYPDDSYVGVDISLNLFDFDKKTSYKSGIKKYESVRANMDYKYKELTAKLSSLKLTFDSNISELKSLKLQQDTLYKIIQSQLNEYNLAQTSYYEMLNSQYDYFSLDKKITELKINNSITRINMFQIEGKVLSI
ncbi:TPA: TolC family protein [Escherichia coli]|nr:TolC family protein [Escherichia coli]